MPTAAELLDLDGVSMRVESIRFDLLDASNTLIRSIDVDRSTTPSITNDVNRTIHRTLDNVRIPPSEAAEIDTFSQRLRPVWVLADGTEYPLGIFLWADASRAVTSYGTTLESSLVDQCLILDQPLTESVNYPEGTVIVDALNDQAVSLGIIETNFEAKTMMMSAPMTWAAGRDTHLDVMSALAAIMGCYTVYFDNAGVCVCRTAADLTVVSADFTYGSGTRVVADTVIRSDDLLSAPNRYVVIGGNSDDNPLVGIYDIPADAPHSAANRGFYVVQVDDVQGLEDQTAATDAALAAYAQDAQAYTSLSFDSTPDPRHDTFNVVAFDGLNYREQSWRLDLTHGGKMAHDCRGTYT